MKIIRDHLGLRKTEGLLGVEIEVEGNNLPRGVQGWRGDNDGSLRGEAVEYVLPEPLSLNKAQRAIDGLYEAFGHNRSKVDDSYRAGVHVHLNVQDMTSTELYTLITLYFVMEGPLTRFCGETREGNHFCMRSSDAEYMTYMIANAAEKDDLNMLHTDRLRYSSLNVTSLFKYGSLEFRAMRSTPDKEAIKTWCSLIASLKEASYQFNNPVDVMNSISHGGEMYFAERVFGKDAKHLLAQYDLNESIRGGLINAQDIAHSRKWDNIPQIDLNIFRQVEVGKVKGFF